MFATEIEKLRRQVGSLDDNAVDDLPGEVWVVRPNFGVANTEKLRRALLGLNEKGFGFADQNDPEIVPNAIDLLSARVQLWTREAGIDLGKLGGTRAITFAEIIDSMRHFARRYNQSPRLALVLSGGGAKCAYQAGAIGSIEKHLLELQDYLVPDPNSVHPDDKPAVHPDVSLVVGTSGGALNALPTAIGTTAGRDGAAARPLAQIWSSIYLLDFFRPYWPVSATLGLFWAALICSGTRIATVTFHASKRWAIHDNRPAFQSTEYEPTIFALRLAAISILILIILLQLYLPGQLYSLGPENRWLFYIAWLPLCICAPWAATFLLFISIGERVLLKRGLLRSVPQETHLWRGFGFICAAGLLLAVTVLCLHKSLSSGDKMQEVIVSKILQILRNDVRPNESILGDQEQRATALSAAICEEGMVRRRDLVMTVSLLGAPGDADRYVYLPAIAEDRPPSYEQRAIKLQRGIGMNFIEDENQVVKLMVASGTIFPVFPARPFVDPAGASQDLYVVDGGFAHNTPIEAAVDWGATHIIVIEASPEITIREKGSFLQNIGSAFDHLFAQAQLTDVRSRQKVEIYTLRPDREILKTLDFMPARIRRAIAQGEQDVEDGRFRQFSRPPTLLSVVGEKDGKQ
jgi:predicted acylesterase/phospholipase RssA